jgi:hypothetical protein
MKERDASVRARHPHLPGDQRSDLIRGKCDENTGGKIEYVALQSVTQPVSQQREKGVRPALVDRQRFIGGVRETRDHLHRLDDNEQGKEQQHIVNVSHGESPLQAGRQEA